MDSVYDYIAYNYDCNDISYLSNTEIYDDFTSFIKEKLKLKFNSNIEFIDDDDSQVKFLYNGVSGNIREYYDSRGYDYIVIDFMNLDI
jgi:hypothetical protein